MLYAAARIVTKLKRHRTLIGIIGVSDGQVITQVFSEKFGRGYRNYEFHLEPFLDITKVKEDLSETASIVVCSEVLEHLEPPIDKAFEGLYKLLRPGGYLILSVPHGGSSSQHVEHFPVMKKSRLVDGPFKILKGVDLEGNKREFADLVFHGGAGSTLEYRIFSETSLRNHLENAGFINIKSQPNKRIIGCFWEPWSRVWTAQKI